eukprot:CAMPEP_0177661950 /NCGR_PEP_ID=MMETSP0447-20121125/19000_1 /TAXON_ID=0 /ORGANISM="Stygamoeba regulata, Strain BSH-02190019" /LENGTH=456 /DNA_ID=CAMNT_0019167423 /DNA_START=38 /DNA_END=1406 /DNA_ORIENTATION=-
MSSDEVVPPNLDLERVVRCSVQGCEVRVVRRPGTLVSARTSEGMEGVPLREGVERRPFFCGAHAEEFASVLAQKRARETPAQSPSPKARVYPCQFHGCAERTTAQDGYCIPRKRKREQIARRVGTPVKDIPLKAYICARHSIASDGLPEPIGAAQLDADAEHSRQTPTLVDRQRRQLEQRLVEGGFTGEMFQEMCRRQDQLSAELQARDATFESRVEAAVQQRVAVQQTNFDETTAAAAEHGAAAQVVAVVKNEELLRSLTGLETAAHGQLIIDYLVNFTGDYDILAEMDKSDTKFVVQRDEEDVDPADTAQIDEAASAEHSDDDHEEESIAASPEPAAFEGRNQKFAHRTLNYMDEFLLVMMYLHTGQSKQELSALFAISPSRCSRIIIAWLEVMDERLTMFNWTASPEEYDMITPHKDRWGSDYSILIDASNVNTHKPSDAFLQGIMYNSYYNG